MDGNVVSWNSGAECVTGFSEGDIEGRAPAPICTGGSGDRVFEQELRNAAAVDRTPDERWHLRKDGSRLWASGMMNAARAADGMLRGFVKIMRDKTERRTIELRMQPGNSQRRARMDVTSPTEALSPPSQGEQNSRITTARIRPNDA
jgi:PAS domain S-box-containing protein